MGFNNKKSIFILLLIILIFSTIVYASSKYDVTDDGGVNLDDVAMVSNLVGSDVEACPRCDVNDDGKIDITDIKLVEDNQDNNKESTKENKDIEAFVTRFYQQCLEREPDKAGLDGWVNGLKTCSKTGADVANGFIFSPEFINRSTTNEEFVTILYRAFFDREPDPGGYDIG